MTRFLFPLLFVPGVALAHEGAHLHQVWAELSMGAMVIALILAIGISAVAAIRVRK